LPEVRIDPLSGYKTIVAGERSRRPGGEPRCAPADPIDPAGDPFAEGHEDRTPPELYAVRPGGGSPDSPGWTVRVVPNLYPALTPGEPAADPRAGGTPAIPTQTGPVSPAELFLATPATGAHEVIVNGPQSVLSLADLSREQVIAAVDAWRERMRAHSASACVQLIVNERREAGASLPHTHAQLYALDFVPADVARERERAGAHATRTMGHDLLEDIVAEEVRRRERIVAIDDDAVLLAPYASRVPFQLMLAPRKPRARFEDDGPTGAALLHDGLRRLARHLGASPPLNLWVRTAPRGAEQFHWHVDIAPRLTIKAGFELGTGVDINVYPPEQAASDLRDCL
jgi:UDPglucose--hexose-1-phosphate uridylyltransferase